MREIYENSAEYREVPRMTRLEYVKEYTEITTHFEKERVKERKILPLYIVFAILNIALIIYLLISNYFTALLVVMALNGGVLSFRRHKFSRKGTKQGYVKRVKTGWMVTFGMVVFPLGSLFNRVKQLNEAEKRMLNDLEERKKQCIMLNTYNAEE